MNHTFSIEEAFRFGWHKTKEHSGIIFPALLTLFGVQIAYAIVSTVLKGTLLGILGSVLLMVVDIWIGVGFLVIALKIAKGEVPHFQNIWPKGKLVWRYLLASLLSGIIIAGGFLLLIVPGVYFALRYSMVRYAVLDGAGVKNSLRKSAAMTADIKWKLLGFFLLVAAMNVVGAIVFMVGLLVTVPVSSIAYAHVYHKLHHRHIEHSA